ncbi:ABC transporter permease [candidate division KSB1 bacterium]
MIDNNKHHPPQTAERIISLFAQYHNRPYILGDLEEDFLRKIDSNGVVFARFWYWMICLRILPGFLKNSLFWSIIMLKNYMKIAWRNFYRNKGISFINIIGLVAGITSFILIQLWINDELSYDKYHEKSGQIYRIATDSKYEGGEIATASTPSVIAKTLLNEYPDVQAAARIRRFSPSLVARREKSFIEARVYAADNSFFDVFTFDLIEGNSENALAEPNTVVITSSMANKYFGKEAPVNMTLNIQDTEYRVTGIIEDMKQNSHFHADFILSGSSFDIFNSDSWWVSYVRTYIVLEKEYPYKEFNAVLDELVFKYRNPGRINTENSYWKWYLQPLTEIHLHSSLSGEFEPNGNMAYVYLFFVISIIILLLACFNFINLTTARVSFRAKEIGVRKVIGSYRTQLMNQFYSETLLLCTISTIVAFVFIKIILPYFNNFLGKKLTLSYSDPLILLYAIGFVLMLSLFSGSYPAIYLSSLRPKSILKGGSHSSRNNNFLRNGLVLFQFSISIILIIGVLVVQRQHNFINNIQLGFDKEQVVIVENASLLGSNVEVFKEKLLQNPSIINVSASGTYPGRYYDGRGVNYDDSKEVLLYIGSTDENFQKTLNIELKEGRYFSENFPSDSSAIIINESAVKHLNWEVSLGKTLIVKGIGSFRVIGVVKDHHYRSKHQKIWPMGMLNVRQGTYPARYFAIKIRTGNIASTLQMIEESWKDIAPGIPYQYCFLDEDYGRLYKSEEQTAEVFSFFSMLALFIGALGLFGLASFVVERRTKEVGIRKAVGANNINILYILMKQFIIWPALAVLFAWPLGWMFMDQWLRNFEYKISLGTDIFLLSGLIAILTAVISVIFQSLKAACKNPVDSLRYE